jgi:16S rRNA (adenine1518-N6/adenine1519-N6)-dimethyltransferase
VGNLPYVISSQILIKVLDEKALLDGCVFLLQKEVAERISSQPGAKSYAPLSIRFQNDFQVRLCFTVKPESFSPPPKVNSALISLEKRTQPLFSVSDDKSFSEFLKTAFRHRRKTLFNNLLLAGHARSQLEPILYELEIPKTVRPEQLKLSAYVDLFNFFLENGIIEG